MTMGTNRIEQISSSVIARPEHLSANATDMLLEVVQKLSLAKDLETIMYIVRRAARQLSSSDGATFVLKDGDMCYYAAEDAIAPLWQGKRFPMTICVSGWVVKHRQPVVIEDIYNDSRVPIEAYRPTFVKSLAMVPIRTFDPIGAIGTYWAEKYRPSAEQMAMLQALADSTSVAMRNVQLNSELELGNEKNSVQLEITRKLIESNRSLEDALTELNHRNQEMQWLKEFSSKLQTCLHIEEAYQLVAEFVKQLLPNAAGILYMMHPSRNYLESMIEWNNPLASEKIIKPDDCLGLRGGAVYKSENAESALACPHCHRNQERPSICLPLYAQSDVAGLFYLECKTDIKDERQQEEQDILASSIAQQIAVGISNIKLRETLRYQSVRDVLTGLYNRRYLEESLEQELSRCTREKNTLSILMIDIDHFKQFNDQFGHEAGDNVIQALAKVLRDFVRKSDIACRYGGEEFLLVMPDIAFDDAVQRAKALHEKVSKIHLRYGGTALTQVTISVGLAMYPKHGKNIQNLIAAADTALYQAKNTGRNKTVVYDSRHAEKS